MPAGPTDYWPNICGRRLEFKPGSGNEVKETLDRIDGAIRRLDALKEGL